MDNSRIEEFIESRSTTELAAELAEKLKQYRTAMTDPEATLSIPDMDMMCMVADEITRRLKT